MKKITEKDYEKIGSSFSKIAKDHNIKVQTCAEERNLTEYGFNKGKCLYFNTAFKLTGKTKLKKWKARNKKECKCAEMVDIGAYNSCRHFCKYCYANCDEKKVIENSKKHNPKSSLLIGELQSDDTIKIRTN